MKLQLEKLFFWMFTSLIFSSCASYKYSESEKRANNTVVINSNVNHFQISFDPMTERQYKGMDNQKLYTDNGSLQYYIPKLNLKCRKIKIESPGYQTEVFKIKRTPRGKIIAKDCAMAFITGPGFFFILIRDAFKSDFYKIKKKHKSIRLELEHIQAEL